MFKIFLIIAAIFLLSNCGRHNEKKTDVHHVDSLAAGNETLKRKQDTSFREDTIYIDSDVFVLGNKYSSDIKRITYVGVKFKPHIFFTDFSVTPVGNQIKAPIKYSSNILARQFKTRITTTYKESNVNFGGHYIFVEWGCGSPCQMSALVDVETGIVYDGVSAGSGYEFKRNSRMLIVNPTDSGEFYLNLPCCEPEIHVWNEKNKKFIQR